MRRDSFERFFYSYSSYSGVEKQHQIAIRKPAGLGRGPVTGLPLAKEIRQVPLDGPPKGWTFCLFIPRYSGSTYIIAAPRMIS